VITIVCTSCGTAIRTSGEYAEVDLLLGEKSEWYPDKYPCANCPAKAALIDNIDPSALKALDLYEMTAQEAYGAFNGLGLPEERECGPMAVGDAFKSSVKKVHCELIKGTNRSVVRHIELEDGTRVYFGSSPYGATVYRIAKRRVSAAESSHG
jgi:hypothetical protein